MAHVAVVLAAYNGERYIARQLKSLAEQTYPDFTVYIRDDGSTDGTVQVIRDFIRERREEARFRLMEDGKGNLGVPESFYEILRVCGEADYYAFCDQDDEWDPDKISRAVDYLSRNDAPGIPAIYISRCRYQDENGTILRETAHQKTPVTLDKVIYHTPASGFTCVFNDALKRKMILEHAPGKEIHDRYFIRGAVCFGKVLYDDRCTAAHIRHEAAVTAGDSGYGSLIRHFFRDEIFGSSARAEKGWLADFYRSFSGELTEKERKILKLFAAEKGNILTWGRKVFYPHRLRSSAAGEIALRMLFLMNRI